MGVNVGIIGYGWVGKAMHKLFPNAKIYDANPREDKIVYSTKEEINKCEVAFICVPTPCNNKKRLDTSLVEECISWCNCPLIVIRSTINPGDTTTWNDKYDKNLVVQPEYLGETPAHPFLDPKTRQFLIIGGYPEDRRKLIELYTTVYNANVTIRQVEAIEAEIIKLTENRAILFKVAQCQELYDVCEMAHRGYSKLSHTIDYYTIRDAVFGDDPRFNLWFTFIYPDKRGANSKCIPKDVYAWCAWAESLGYNPEITKAILERNEKWICQS